MKTLTKEIVDFTIEPLEEHASIQNVLSFKETGADHSEYIQRVLDDDGLNPWLWCTVKVTAKFKGLEGSAYLGQCAYESESDFIKGGYYEQMREEAFADLKAQVDNLINALV